MHYLPGHTGAVSSKHGLLTLRKATTQAWSSLSEVRWRKLTRPSKGIAYLQDRSCSKVCKPGRVIKVGKSMAVEWRPTGHNCLENSPALLWFWVVFQDQTDCLQLGYVPSVITATQGLIIFVQWSRNRQSLTILTTLSIRFCQPRRVPST